MTITIRIRRAAMGIAVACAGVVLSGQQPPAGSPPVPLEKLTLPAGFRIAVYADDVRGARSMALGAKGTVFVGTRAQPNVVYALVDRNRDFKADEVKVVAKGLRQPNGIAFHNGSLYVAESTRVIRYDDIEAKLDAPPEPVVVHDGLPVAGGHTWRFIGVGPDGLLYVGMGAPCNVCERLDEPKFSTIIRMKLDGSGAEVFAHGVRNTVGFDWHPQTREIWFTDNGRDDLGDDVPNDELNIAPKAGLHFGFPYCHQGTVKDPTFGDKKPCSETVAPVQMMGPHVAAIGMRFYTGSMFPREYRSAAIIAQHGSWNRSQPIGYRVMVAKNDGRKVTSFEPLVDGFLHGIRGSGRGNRVDGDAYARPVDVLVMPDGSVLVSDDQGGRIFRVSYGK
jgi:glucose/arabinose dehydrogenase